jgi:hypothetical protein
MPIYRLLQNVPMGPEDIRRLTTAYEQTLRTIGLVDRNDPIAEMIAKKIIEIAQTGVKDPAQLSALAIKEIGIRRGPRQLATSDHGDAQGQRLAVSHVSDIVGSFHLRRADLVSVSVGPAQHPLTEP